MDIRKIRHLAKLLHQEGISEIEIQEGEFYLRLTRTLEKEVTNSEIEPPASSVPAEKQESPSIPSNAKVISSPLSGTFYQSKSPGAPPFVNVGDEFAEGKILCILEAMKMMNELEAPENGRIIEICVENSKPVQEGQPLFRYIPL